LCERQALDVLLAPSACTGYRHIARIATPSGSNERGQPIARCTLKGTLAQTWPKLIATSDYTRH
jgi:hypothetical protein